MKILSVVILLLNVLHPNWMVNKFFNATVDQAGSTSITLSQEFSYEVIKTSDSSIVEVTGFQISNFSGKFTSGKEQMVDLTKSENRQGVVRKGSKENEYVKMVYVFYRMGAEDHLDFYSCYNLNKNKSWTVWQDFKYRNFDEGEVADLNGYSYLIDDRGKCCKYYLVNTGEKINWRNNFYLNAEEGNLFTDFTSCVGGKLEKHNLSLEILFNRERGKQNTNIYPTGNKRRQISIDKGRLLMNEVGQHKFNYSIYLKECLKSNEKPDLCFVKVNKIFNKNTKDDHLLSENGPVKYEDDPVIYTIRFHENIKTPQVTWKYNTAGNIGTPVLNTNNNGDIVPLINLRSPYIIPFNTYCNQLWCCLKSKTQNNSTCMHEYLTKCFNKSNKPNHVIMQA